MGDKDGMKLPDCQFPLPGVDVADDDDGDGDTVTLSLADDGAELDGHDATVGVETRCDLDSADDGPGDAATESLLVTVMGRNRSRVKSNISDPMAPMAPLYRSLLILDSLTKNSANRRTRAASSAALASFSANVLNLSTVARENCSTVCLTTICRVSGLVGDLGPGVIVSTSWNGPREEERLCGGGVGRAFGAMVW
jgi:hypothetical protein